MAFAEPTGALWAGVGPRIGGWPDTDEDAVEDGLGGGWSTAEQSVRAAAAESRGSAAGTAAAWDDSAGAVMSGRLLDTSELERAGDGFVSLADRSQHFAGAVRAAKGAISETIAVNEPLYQLAMAVPVPGAADQFADAVAAHLDGVVEQQVAAVAGYGPGPGGPTLADARAFFFDGPPPDLATRQVVQTDAVVPGGQDGIILLRGYIANEDAAFGQLYGDDRGPTTDLAAPSRFDVAWDTRTGEVAVTVHCSTVVPQSVFQEQSPYTQDRHVAAFPVNVGPGTHGTPWANNFELVTGPGQLGIRHDLINSGMPDPFRWGAVQGDTTLTVQGGQIHGSASGEDYPDREVVQYRPEGARLLNNAPMGPGGGPAGQETEIFGEDYDTFLGSWSADR